MSTLRDAHYKVLQRLPPCDFSCAYVGLHYKHHMAVQAFIREGAKRMNLLIKSISISLLSLISVGTALAKPGLGRDIAHAKYVGDPSNEPDPLSRPLSQQHEAAASWREQENAASAMRDNFAPPSAPSKAEVGKLSPEQRRLLRYEINEAARELYRPK